MTDQPLTAIPRPAQVPRSRSRLEPDAIVVAQDTIIGLASSAPAATMAVTMVWMAATAAYGGGPVIILCGIPMLILANTYRRLNLWNANCGASFEGAGRAINPYLGFIVGWMMLAGCLTGTISVVVVLSPAWSWPSSAPAPLVPGRTSCSVPSPSGLRLRSRWSESASLHARRWAWR